MELDQLKRIVEAALLAAGQPLSLVALSGLFGENEEVSSDAIGQALEALANDYAGRGIELVEVASGFRVQVRQDVHPWVSRLWTERQTKYSRALLETLALIAYRQPITRAEIEQIRGVAVSTHIVKTLEEREWIRVVGHRDVPGKPALFGTTRQFLDYFNLKSLDELPPLSEIRDIEDLEPQLDLPHPDGAGPQPIVAQLEDLAENDGADDDGQDGDARLDASTEAANESTNEEESTASYDNVVPLHPDKHEEAGEKAPDENEA